MSPCLKKMQRVHEASQSSGFYNYPIHDDTIIGYDLAPSQNGGKIGSLFIFQRN